MLIFYADKSMVMGNSENSCVFNLAILLQSRKLDACEILVFYNILFAVCRWFCKNKWTKVCGL